MTLSTLVYARLAATNAVTHLVGTRITPEVRGASTSLPALVYGIESNSTVQAFVKASHHAAEVETLVLSTTKSGAATLASAVVESLERYVGEDASIRILSCIHSRSTQGYLSPIAGENLGVFTESDIFSVLFVDI